MDTDPCDVCGAEFLVGGSATRYPRTTAGLGDPTSAMLSEALAGDMYYDLSTGIGWLCQSAGDVGKVWTKAVGFGFAEAGIDLSQYVKFTDLTDEKYNYVTYDELTKDILGDAPVNGEAVLKKYALASEVESDIAAVSDQAKAAAEEAISNGMADYLKKSEAKEKYLLRSGYGDEATQDAGKLYLAIADFNAETYLKALAKESGTPVKDAYFVLTRNRNLQGSFLDDYLELYLMKSDFDKTAGEYINSLGLCKQDYVDKYFYNSGTVDSKLSGKASIEALATTNTSVAANTNAIAGIKGEYLKSSDAEGTYLKQTDYTAGVTLDDVAKAGYAKISTALDATTESDTKAPSVNAVKSYVTTSLSSFAPSVDVGAAVDAALDERLPDFAVQAGSAAKLVALSGDGPYALANFAISSVTVGTAATGATFTLPAATAGVARNFALVIEIPSGWTGSSFTLTLTPQTGETVSYFGGFSASFDMSGVAAGETVMYSFAEIMAGKFRVARCLLDSVAVS